MPENTISSIHSVMPETGAQTIKQAVQASQLPKEAAEGVSQKSSVAGNVSNENNRNQAERPTDDAETSSHATQNEDIRLKFQVDSKTNALTVYVLDKSSQRVIRTIPPGELKKLREGDLISLFT